jgi:hypothetical protein
MKACRWVPEHLRNMNMGQDSSDRNGGGDRMVLVGFIGEIARGLWRGMTDE